MRIHFTNMSLPKRAAKRVHKLTAKPNQSMPQIGDPFRLSDAQRLTAWMYGYESWHELEVITERNDLPSRLDEECETQDQNSRLAYQQSMLMRFFPYMPNDVAEERALEFRVSAKNPASDDLKDQRYRKNRVIKYPYNENGNDEWRFKHSLRVKQNYNPEDDLWELNSLHEQGAAGFDYKSVMKRFIKHLDEYPEDFYIIHDILHLALDNRDFDAHAERALDFYSQIVECFADEFPASGRIYMCWGYWDQRHFLFAIPKTSRLLELTGQIEYANELKELGRRIDRTEDIPDLSTAMCIDDLAPSTDEIEAIGLRGR